MNSLKLSALAVAAVAVLAGQASANDPAAKDAAKEACANGCAKKAGNENGTCGGKVAWKQHKTADACTKNGGKWMKAADIGKDAPKGN